MLDLIQRVNWNEYLLVLSQGSPPISYQLAALNVLLVSYWVMRRARSGKAQRGSAWLLQALFVVGNIGVVTWGGRLSF